MTADRPLMLQTYCRMCRRVEWHNILREIATFTAAGAPDKPVHLLKCQLCERETAVVK